MRELAMRGGPFTADEQAALLDYCETDVDALARLFPKMLPHIDWPRALIRGRYMAAAAHIERNGVPIDTKTLTRLRENWDRIQDRLIAAIDTKIMAFTTAAPSSLSASSAILPPTTSPGLVCRRASSI